MPLKFNPLKGKMKSVGVTFSPVEFLMLAELCAAYNANRSEILRAAVRTIHAQYRNELVDDSVEKKLTQFDWINET